ncbi:MAG: lanthionine synthetase LanC family protein [Mangrovibacterium sp.]
MEKYTSDLSNINAGMKFRVNSRLLCLANVLLLNASFIDNLGLFNGKMGIAIFFYHYAKYTGNKVYENYAGDLLDEIYEEINVRTPADFTCGLTGVGWGIEYLVQNEFIEAETDEVLKEIDQAVFVSRWKHPVLVLHQDDLFGFGLYYLSRLKGKEHDHENLETLKKKEMLIYLMNDCERLLTKEILFDVSVPRLALYQVNSLLWFILETRKLDLFPVKSDKLIHQLAEYLETKMERAFDLIDLAVFRCLMKKLKDLIPNPDLYRKYDILMQNLGDNCDPVNDEQLINEYIKSGWYPLLYNLSSVGIQKEKTERAFNLVDNEENWNRRLNKLDKNNLGLNMGMAGLGLALLQKVKINNYDDE